jgi:hypothetical protein
LWGIAGHRVSVSVSPESGTTNNENAITVAIVGTLIDTSEVSGLESGAICDNGFARSDEFEKIS